MADDSVLAGVLGALEGFGSVYLPYQQAKFKNTLDRQSKAEDLNNQFSLFKQKLPIEMNAQKDLAKYQQDVQPTVPLYNEQSREIIQPPAGSKRMVPFNNDITNKTSKEQDTLEEKARSRLSSIRGDASLARTESQRDASIQAYNTIAQAEKEGRILSKPEYYDILGQLWKARSGASPTIEAIQDLDNKTFKGDISKAFTYITGKTAGATTKDVMNNIKNFAKSTGAQMDKMHEGYMQTHLDMPTTLESSRAEHLKKLARGQSFAEATGANETVNNNDPLGLGF